MWVGFQLHYEFFIIVFQCLQRMDIYANFLSGSVEGFITRVYQIHFPERNGKLTLLLNESSIQMKHQPFHALILLLE